MLRDPKCVHPGLFFLILYWLGHWLELMIIELAKLIIQNIIPTIAKLREMVPLTIQFGQELLDCTSLKQFDKVFNLLKSQ